MGRNIRSTTNGCWDKRVRKDKTDRVRNRADQLPGTRIKKRRRIQ